mgnify:CR=1 FL=1
MEMNLIERNGVFYVDSRQVAEITSKRHDHLVRDIDGYIAVINQNPNLGADDFFVESSYTAGTGKAYKCYLLTKKGCDMVANKMTGEKGILFTATYINKFYEMEKKLHEQVIPSEYQLKALDIKEKELSLRESELYLRIADSVSVPEYKQIMNSLAVKAVSGEMYLPLPAVNQKTYSATDIGDILGVSANKIGRLARQFNMKTPEYGKYFYDKAKYSSKELETFRYYGNAIDKFKSILDV